MLWHNPAMRLRFRFAAATGRGLDKLAARLSGQDALVLPSLIGLAAGLLAGLVMVAFREVIEAVPPALFGIPHYEGFEDLGPAARFLLPVGGGLIVGLIFQALAPPTRAVGVVHVLERLAYDDGVLPLRNALVQFVTGAISLACGHSAGREGPAIHIGAATASWLGQRARLPHNYLRVLAGCGTAGAIAASFNTPLAGVIFAMEVVLAEYTLSSFAPIILAAVSATAVSRAFFGSEATLMVFTALPYQPVQLVYAVAIGLMAGTLASILIRSLGFLAGRSRNLAPWKRCLLAGAITGLLAVPAPTIMGLGYDTLRDAVEGALPLSTLLILVFFKLAATASGLGLGLPGGVIGPTLVIGAGAGGAVGAILALAAPGTVQPTELNTLVGMMAMMGATLHAPLAALTALVELAANPDFIFPGMLAVITAYLTNRVLTRTGSVFEAMARARGVEFRSDPLFQSLRRLAVGRALNQSVRRVPARVTREALISVLQEHPDWLLVDPPTGGMRLVRAAEVDRLLEAVADGEIDLLEAALHRLPLQPIALRSTLAEALRRMEANGVNALYVVGPSSPAVLGVLTREDVERSYRR